MRRRHVALAARFFLIALVAWGARVARAAGDFREGFETPDASWRYRDANVQFRVVEHARVHDAAHSGHGSERIRLEAGNGTYLRFEHATPQARVIDEVQAAVWVKSQRAGLQLFARVVLPRTVDPGTGRPVATIVAGGSYQKVGAWEQLRVENLPLLVERQARLLRAELRRPVDTRQAYIDGVLLNVYGGIGETDLFIDDLELTGCFRPDVVQVGYAPDAAQSGRAMLPPRPAVRLVGDLLTVDGEPFFPRAVEHRGEPLEFLARLGFNVVQISGVSTHEQLDEASRLGLWIICQPPIPAEIQQNADGNPASTEIGPAYDRVLMWHLGAGLARGDVERVGQWSRAVRLADRDHRRPLLCAPITEVRVYSRKCDVLSIGRQPLASTLEPTEYAEWISARTRLARPGTPFWAEVQTHVPESVLSQWQAISGRETADDPITADQIRWLVYAALSTGPRGLYFSTRTRLDASDAASRARAMALELLNRELDLIEPWTASGQLVGTILGSEAESRGTVFQLDRSRLVLAHWASHGAQFAPPQSAASGASFVVPGVPESHRAFELTPSGLSSVRDKRRVAGGIRVTLDEFGASSMIVLTEDPLTQAHLQRELSAAAPRSAQLARELALARSLLVERTESILSARGPQLNDVPTPLRTATQHVELSERLLAAGDYARAYAEANRALRPLRMLERARWDQARATFESATASPFAVAYETLPQHWTLVANLRSAEFGRNLLLGGNLERLDTLERAGWRHFRHDQPGVETTAELSPDEPNSGRYSLKLSVRPTSFDAPPVAVEASPVWITTPGIPVDAGQLFRVHGYVRVPKPITGSVDGLLIVDSAGGEALAERVHQTDGWQEFMFFRAAQERGELRVTFALSGLGEAYLDDVSIEPVLSSTPRNIGPQASAPSPLPPGFFSPQSPLPK